MSYRAVNTSVEFVLAFSISALPVLTGCGPPNHLNESMPKTNETILREIDSAGLWFHAKKTGPIWVRRLAKEESVPTLEGVELVPAGNYVCRGQLSGKPGDYIVKQFEDRDDPNPSDVWIVDQRLFNSTYERVTIPQ